MIWKISIYLLVFMNIITICKLKKFHCINGYKDTVKPLILTELIAKGEITEAQAKAFVLLEGFRDVLSYSGYFQVDKQYDSNLFFWYFPSQSNTDPLILWLQGGPGLTSFIGIFSEGGPFKLESKFEVGLKMYSWIKNYSIIYMDSPVGSGYSYTKLKGYAKNQDTITHQLYNALTQFLKMFPTVVNSEFYILGEGYAGKSAITLAKLIHISNPNTKIKINLKGIVIGSGFCDPINQVNYGDYLYQIGLIDRNIRKEFYFVENCMKDHIKRGKFKEAFKTYDYLINGGLDSKTLFQNLTGLDNYHNYVCATGLRNFIHILSYYVNLDAFRRALHVGFTHFNATSPIIEENLEYDIMQSAIHSLPPLLDNYKVLFYNGQLDILVRSDMTETFLYKIRYEHIDKFRNTKRCIWRLDNEIAGYAKGWGNLTQVVVRDAGHFVPADQPKWALNMMNRFVRNINFCS